MLFPTLRDRGDELLKGLLLMAWLLMAITDAISWVRSEENRSWGGLKHCDVAGKETEARNHKPLGRQEAPSLGWNKSLPSVQSAMGFSSISHASLSVHVSLSP